MSSLYSQIVLGSKPKAYYRLGDIPPIGTYYGSVVASVTLTTAGDLSTTTGGTESFNTTFVPGSGGPFSGYGDIFALGGNPTIQGSIPSPTGNGWLYDSTALEGKTIPAGNWSASVTMASGFGNAVSGQTWVIRFSKRSSGGVYTTIGSITLTNQTLGSTKTTTSFPATSMSSVSFSTGDKLYVDLWINSNWYGSSNASGWEVVCYESNSGTQGVANEMQINIPASPFATDSSGNGYKGTYSSTGVTYSVAGAITGDSNTAVTFDGSSGDMACPLGVDPSTFTALTIECWVKLSTLTLSTSPALFANEVVGTSHKGVALNFNSNATALNFALGNGSAATTCTGSFTFATSTWYHLAVTWDGSTMTIYVNGVSKGTASFTGPIASSLNSLTLGHNPGGTDYFTGTVDEWTIYNSALSAQSVLDHYNVGIQADGGGGLYRVANGGFILASDVDQLIEILQQNAGGQELGKYYLSGNAYTNAAYIGVYIASLSKGSTPVSVSIDTADQVATNINAPATDKLSVYGFEVQATSTAASASCTAGGNYTLQY